MLKANFTITETGGTGIVQLQSSADTGVSWQDLGSPLTLAQGALTVDDQTHLAIDTTVFIPGQSYEFRLTDQAGTPISNVITYTVPYVQHYAAGGGMIGFTHTGGDDYTATFSTTPGTIYDPDTTTLAGIQCKIEFWHAGSLITIVDQQVPQTTDQTFTMTGNGPGVYACQLTYVLTDGQGYSVGRYVKVDGSGTTIADIQANGTSAISLTGHDLTETADFIQTGVSYPIAWLAIAGSGVSMLGTGTTLTATLPADIILLIATAQVDAVISDDFNGDVVGYAHNITVGP